MLMQESTRGVILNHVSLFLLCATFCPSVMRHYVLASCDILSYLGIMLNTYTHICATFCPSVMRHYVLASCDILSYPFTEGCKLGQNVARDIMSCDILSLRHFVLRHFVRATFCPATLCPRHFVRRHFVLRHYDRIP